MTRYILATILILSMWVAGTVWQITVREGYALQTRQDAPQRQDGAGQVDSTLSTLAQDLDKLSAEVDRLERSQRENIDRLRTISRGEGEMLMLATGYTAGPESTGKSPGHPEYGITYSGLKADSGVAAVDPKVIPLKSVLWIEGYGYAIALDTGRDIVGLRIDLFFHRVEDALQWGRKRVRVKVLSKE